MNKNINLAKHRVPKNFRDKIAFCFVKILRFIADLFFAKRYGHRAVVLETVAAVPGMVGGAIQHLKSLRLMRDDNGWIKTLLDEAENERQHLMTFIQISSPTILERLIVVIVQFIFFNLYFFLYLVSAKTCHRIVGYFEEEAVISYTQYLEEIDKGEIENIPAPESAIQYWNLSKNAKLRDVIIAIRADEINHREVNHKFADILDAP
ncbi:MAG: oxidase [Legionellales bacterium]|nr:oxidase [Legionellales bacterium]